MSDPGASEAESGQTAAEGDDAAGAPTTDHATADGGTEEAPSASSGRATRRRPGGGEDDSAFLDPEMVGTYLQWGVLVAFVLLGVVAGAGLYTSVGRVIEVWVTERYQPVVRTVFNAGMLLLAAAGASAVLRRLDGDG